MRGNGLYILWHAAFCTLMGMTSHEDHTGDSGEEEKNRRRKVLKKGGVDRVQGTVGSSAMETRQDRKTVQPPTWRGDGQMR